MVSRTLMLAALAATVVAAAGCASSAGGRIHGKVTIQLSGRFAHPGDKGTFTMSGAVIDAGTFVRYCIDCNSAVVHLGGTFTGKKGTFAVDDEISSVSHDSWRILSGSGDYAGLRGSGLCRGKIVVQEVSFRGSCTGSVRATARDAARDTAAFARAHAALGPLVPPKGRKLRVGIVTDAGVVATNRIVDGLPLLGFERAVKAFGVDARVVYVAPGDDSTEALRSLARQRYDLIIAPTFDVEPVDIVAAEFPAVRFYLPGAPVTDLQHPHPNVQGSVFRAEQAGYLAGYLSGLMERMRPGKQVIGAVSGTREPGVTRWTIGYEAGAKLADPGVTFLNTYTHDFVNPTKCRRAALEEIGAGAGVLFQVAAACGLGTLAAAKEKRVWGVGVDVDQSYLGPQILTSAEARLDVGVFGAIQRATRGTFTTGANTVYDLRNGGVALGRISDKVPAAVLRRVEAVRRRIVAGRIKVPHVT